jgi:putative membrane protein
MYKHVHSGSCAPAAPRYDSLATICSRDLRYCVTAMRLLISWLLNAGALLAVAYFVPAIHVESFFSALIAALVLGLVNAVMRPLLILLTLPVTLLTLGLFIFVINGLLFWLVGSILSGFVVDGFWPAFFGAIAYSIFSWALNALINSRKDS